MNVKKIFTLISAVLLAFTMTACNATSDTADASKEQVSEPKTVTEETNKMLIAYFSCTGTTEKVAQDISEILQADLH